MNQINAASPELLYTTSFPDSTQMNKTIFSLGFFSVPGLWHSDALRKQALLHQSGGICLCYPQYLPGHHLPVQLPAPDYGWRPWINHLHQFTSHWLGQVVFLASFFSTFSGAKRPILALLSAQWFRVCHPSNGVTCNFLFFFLIVDSWLE